MKLSGGGKSSGIDRQKFGDTTPPPRRFSVFSIQKMQNPTGVVSPNFCRVSPNFWSFVPELLPPPDINKAGYYNENWGKRSQGKKGTKKFVPKLSPTPTGW